MYPEKNLYQWHVVHYKSHVKWSEIELGPPVIRGRRLKKCEIFRCTHRRLKKCEILDAHIGDIRSVRFLDTHIGDLRSVRF